MKNLTYQQMQQIINQAIKELKSQQKRLEALQNG